MRVLIVDDHPVTRDGLRTALSVAPDIDVVGEAATGEDAVELVRAASPDVVFMDVRMPGMGGLEATRAIRRIRPQTRVILFTMEESRMTVADAIRAGISGYLLKDVSAAELIGAARLALEGKAVIHPAITLSFVQEAEEARSEQRLAAGRGSGAALSPREIEVLDRIAAGATTGQVARDLGVSARTVKTHLERAFQKLGATDRAQAVALAIRRGLLAQGAGSDVRHPG